jgi:hypothetical protein
MSIYLTTPGWTNITNPVQVTPGTLLENSQQFEIRRQASVAKNANGTSPAIRSAIMSLPGIGNIVSAYVLDNPANTPVTVGGLSIPANSVYVCVYGYPTINSWPSSAPFVPTDVPKAIWTTKSLGCSYAPSWVFQANGQISSTSLTVDNFLSGVIAPGQTLLQAGSGQPYLSSAPNGSVPLIILSGTGGTWTLNFAPGTAIPDNTPLWSATTFQVTDPNYNTSPPSYWVSFTQPIQLQIYIQVTLASASNPPNTALSTLQSSTGLLTAFSGTDGLPPVAQIGQAVFSSRFYPTVTSLFPGISVVSILVSTTPSFTTSSVSVPVNINQIPMLGNPATQVSLVLV